jgi:hypothetical protein
MVDQPACFLAIYGQRLFILFYWKRLIVLAVTLSFGEGRVRIVFDCLIPGHLRTAFVYFILPRAGDWTKINSNVKSRQGTGDM